jgi:hypothetical protein
LPLMSKGERKIKMHEDRGDNGHKGSMSVYINGKGGDCWKFSFHSVMIPSQILSWNH